MLKKTSSLCNVVIGANLEKIDTKSHDTDNLYCSDNYVREIMTGGAGAPCPTPQSATGCNIRACALKKNDWFK